jgi:hypothetical protein
MAVYKFKVTFEDPDDVSRDIEIKPGQTFGDFHKAIQQSINFDARGEAAFFTSDDYWRKETQIKFEELEQKKILEFIEDPHQKFIYEYDLPSKWTFAVELLKILPDESGVKYPRCVKTTGKAPAQYHAINPVALTEDQKESDEVIDDTMFYREAEEMIADDDYAEGKSIEGEDDFASSDGEEESEFEEEGFEESAFEDED